MTATIATIPEHNYKVICNGVLLYFIQEAYAKAARNTLTQCGQKAHIMRKLTDDTYVPLAE